MNDTLQELLTAIDLAGDTVQDVASTAEQMKLDMDVAARRLANVKTLLLRIQAEQAGKREIHLPAGRWVIELDERASLVIAPAPPVTPQGLQHAKRAFGSCVIGGRIHGAGSTGIGLTPRDLAEVAALAPHGRPMFLAPGEGPFASYSEAATDPENAYCIADRPHLSPRT